MRAAIFIIIFSLLALSLSGELGAVGGPEAVIAEASGEVTALAIDGKQRPLLKGDPVSAGEMVETGRKSRAVIVLADGGKIILAQSSKLLVSDSRANVRGASSVSIFFGRAAVTSGTAGSSGGLEVNTLTTVAGVRGTEFVVAVAMNGTSRTGVNKGQVSSSGPGAPALVGAGKALDVGLDGKSSSAKFRDDQGAWDNFFQDGKNRLRKDPEQVMSLLAALMKSSRAESEKTMKGLESRLQSFRALKKEIESKPRVIIPDAEKKRLVESLKNLFGDTRSLQLQLHRLQAAAHLIRLAAEDANQDPGAYPGDKLEAVMRAHNLVKELDPDGYYRRTMMELSRILDGLEDDALRFDLLPALNRTPAKDKRKKLGQDQNRIKGLPGSDPDKKPGREPPPGTRTEPDLPPMIEPPRDLDPPKEPREFEPPPPPPQHDPLPPGEQYQPQ